MARFKFFAIILLMIAVAACDAQDPSFETDVVSNKQPTGEDQTAFPDGRDSTIGDLEPNEPGDGDQGKIPVPAKVMMREQVFLAQSIGQGNLTKELDSSHLSLDLTLQREHLARSKSVQQITRPLSIDNIDQGNSPASESQMFDQVVDRKLDIVVVIDNSGSMAEEQQNMSSKLAPLLSYVQDSDWQIGVVTTDPDEGCLRKLIKKTDTNVETLFAQAVTAGINRSGNERGILQAVRTMSGTCLTQPWIRQDSTIATLIVSDEDNCSANGGDCPGKDYASSNYLYNYLASIREPGKNARVYGLIWHPSQTKAQCSTGANKAVMYADVIARTSGTWGSICASDYTATLSQISQDMMGVLNSKFTLTYIPETGSVKVFVDGTEKTSGINVTGKVVELSPAPPIGAKIMVNYRYGSSPIKSTFALRYVPDPAGLTVKINGQNVNHNDYTVDAAGAKITFNQTPAEYAKIVVSYTRNDVPLVKDFPMTEAIQSGTLTVKKNNVLVSNYTVNWNTGVISFSQAPGDGSTLAFNYKSNGAPILSYAVSAPLDTVPFEAYDANTNARVNVTYSHGKIQIAAGDFVENRRLYLLYENLGRQRFAIELPNAPLENIKAIGGQITCTDPSKILVEDRIVKVEGCGFPIDITAVTISYKYLIANHKVFEFAANNLPSAKEYQKWSVFVDDMPSDDFTRVGNKIIFDQELPFGAKVKVQLEQADKT